VIAVIGIMAVGLVIALNPLTQIQKAQDAKRKGDISQIQKALETYYQDNGVYPLTASALDYRIKGLDGNPVSWGSAWQPYMSILPRDPNSPAKNYVYNASANGQTYYIYASLDRGINDPQICHSDGTACSSLPAGVSCGTGTICNYGASSPNVSP